MRDEVQTQTEKFNFHSSDQALCKDVHKSIETDKFASEEDKLEENLPAQMKAKLVPQQENFQEKKIRTTPHADEGIEMFSRENKIFSTLVHGSSKKKSIYSMQKNQQNEYENNPYMIKIPENMNFEEGNNEEQTNFEPINMDQNSIDEYEETDEVQLEDQIKNQEQENNKISDIFKNTNIIQKSGGHSKARYIESDEEGEDDFYYNYDNSPQNQPGNSDFIETKDQAIGGSSPKIHSNELGSQKSDEIEEFEIDHPQRSESPEYFYQEDIENKDLKEHEIIGIQANNEPVEEIQNLNEINDNYSDKEEEKEKWEEDPLTLKKNELNEIPENSSSQEETQLNNFEEIHPEYTEKQQIEEDKYMQEEISPDGHFFEMNSSEGEGEFPEGPYLGIGIKIDTDELKMDEEEAAFYNQLKQDENDNLQASNEDLRNQLLRVDDGSLEQEGEFYEDYDDAIGHPYYDELNPYHFQE